MGKNKTPEVAPSSILSDALQRQKTVRRVVVQTWVEQQELYGGRVMNLGSRMVVYTLTPSRNYGQQLQAEIEDLIAAVDTEYGELPWPPEA